MALPLFQLPARELTHFNTVSGGRQEDWARLRHTHVGPAHTPRNPRPPLHPPSEYCGAARRVPYARLPRYERVPDHGPDGMESTSRDSRQCRTAGLRAHIPPVDADVEGDQGRFL